MLYPICKRNLKSGETGPNGVQHHEVHGSHVNQDSSALELLILPTAPAVWELLLVMLLWAGVGGGILGDRRTQVTMHGLA